MSIQAPYQNFPFNGNLGEMPIDASVQRNNCGFLAPGQTKLSVCVDNVSTPTGTIYYIPLPIPQAGKIWIFTDMNFTHNQSTGQRFAIAIGGVSTLATQCHGSTAPDILGSQETQPDCPGGLQPSIQILGVSGMNSWVNLAGIQQNSGNG